MKKPTSTIPIKDVDGYIATLPVEVREVVEKLRQIIKKTAPDAEEVISYRMPAYKYHGMLVGFAGWKDHVGFYPWNSTTVDEFKDELKGYSTSKGAIQFPLEEPIPTALVKKIIRARMKENEQHPKAHGKKS